MSSSPRPRNRPAPERIGDLSCLPVFFTLKDKPVLVAGGTEAAAWKAELLAASGARVQVHAAIAERCVEMAALIETGRCVGHDTAWRDADWRNMVLAVGDCDEAEAASFVAVAENFGVPVNVIDQPAYCQFQFGSIVNRSPLVIGISTTGAAPILGQAVRRRIEAVLPAGLAGWADLAMRMRERVNDLVQPGLQRRRFWERLSRSAFENRPDPAAADTWLHTRSTNSRGHIVEIECAGDPEDLTLRQVRQLQSADIVVYDEDVRIEVLELARREATRIPMNEFASDCGAREYAAKLARAGRNIARVMPQQRSVNGGNQKLVEAMQSLQ